MRHTSLTSTCTKVGRRGAVASARNAAPPLLDTGDSLEGIPASFFLDMLDVVTPQETSFSGGSSGGGGGTSTQCSDCPSDRSDVPSSSQRGSSRFTSDSWEGGRLGHGEMDRRAEHSTASDCNLDRVSSTQHGEVWRASEWTLNPYTLAVTSMDTLSTASDTHTFENDDSSATTTKKEGGKERAEDDRRLTPVLSISKRETMRRTRDERARVKRVKVQAKRDEMVRRGVKCCDVIGCSEPRTASSRRICAVHWGAEELVLEGEELVHRWCMHCYALHPLSAFSPVSRTICLEKYDFRKQRRIDRMRAKTLEPEPEEEVGMVAELEPTSSSHVTNAAALSAERTSVYVSAHRYDVLDMKLGMHPAAIAAANDAFLWHAAAATVPDGGFQPARAGTPAAAAMSPGCTHLTVSSMVAINVDTNGFGGSSSACSSGDGVGVGDDEEDSGGVAGDTSDSRNRVIRMVASTGATELLRGERWGVTLASSGGANDDKSDVYCATAYGGLVVAEHKGLSWPTDARPPLCIVADADVVMDMLDSPQPVAVRWFGDGINVRSFASVDDIPPVVSCHVPPSSRIGILSVQMLVHGQAMGSEFQHILVLPNDDEWSVVFAREIEGLDNFTNGLPLPSGKMSAAEKLRRNKLRRIITTDLAWLLCAEESCAVYDNRTVIARGLRIASGLRQLFSHNAGCPSLQRRLRHIEQDLLDADADAERNEEDSASENDNLSCAGVEVADDDLCPRGYAALRPTTEGSDSLQSQRVLFTHKFAALMVLLSAVHFYTFGHSRFVDNFAYSGIHVWVFWVWVFPVALGIVAVRSLYGGKSPPDRPLQTTGDAQHGMETVSRTPLMEAVYGFHPKFLETEFQSEKIHNANAVLPSLQLVTPIILLAYHYKVLDGCAQLPPVVIRDCTISVALLCIWMPCALLFQSTFKKRIASAIHPYDGLLTACFFHLVYVHDAVVFFTRDGTALLWYALWFLHLLLAIAYAMPPLHYWVLCVVTGASSALKVWMFNSRWSASEFSRVIDFKHEAMQLAPHYILWSAVTSLVILRVEYRLRRRFIANRARKLHYE